MNPVAGTFVRLTSALVLLLLVFLSTPAQGETDPALDRGASIWRFSREIARPLAETPSGAVPTEDPVDLRDATWQFNPSIRIHPDEGGQHVWPDLAVAPDGLILAAWMDDHAAGGYHIFASFSTDDGASWSEPEQIDTRTSGAYSKFVDLELTPSGMPIAVWEDDREGEINVFFSKRDPDNGGTPWTPNVRVNTMGGPTYGGDFMNPSIAAYDEQRYYVAWTDWREGVFHQVYMRSTTDGGSTWGTETRVSDGLGYEPVAGDPCLIVDRASSPEAVVLSCVTNDWRGDVPGGRYPNVFFYRSSDGGATWSVGVMVNDVEPYYQQTSSHGLVLLEDGTLTAGWLNNPNLTMHHYNVNVSTDQGATWGSSVQVDEPSSGGTGTYSSIAAIGGSVFAAMDIYTADWDAYFRASTDGGRSWSEPMVRIDDDATGSPTSSPVLAPLAADRVAAAWADGRVYPSTWKIYATVGVQETAGLEEPHPGSWSAGGLLAMPNPSRVGRGVLLRLVDRDGGDRIVGIYGSAGRRLRSVFLIEGEGVWDGRDEQGRSVPSGVYWVRSSRAQGEASGRIVRLD